MLNTVWVVTVNAVHFLCNVVEWVVNVNTKWMVRVSVVHYAGGEDHVALCISVVSVFLGVFHIHTFVL